MLSKRKLKNSAKNLSTTLQVEIDPLDNKVGSTRIIKDPPSLVYPMYSLQALATNRLLRVLSSLTFQIPQFNPIASTNEWLLPILSGSTKISLHTQNGCGKYLGQQSLKDIEMERQELRKTTRKCVDDCGYNNLYLSSVFFRVFSLKSTSYNLWVMRVYIVYVKTW